VTSAPDLRSLDHVAVWVADRASIADFATHHLGMHVIDEQDRFTLVGADARRGKLTLFAAEGPRERGALQHVALRVSDLGAALEALPPGLDLDHPRPGEAYFEVAGQLRVGLVDTGPAGVEYDLDHVALLTREPAAAAAAYEQLGFLPAAAGPSGAPRVEAAGAFVEFVAGDPGDPERPLLNHVAVLVDAAAAAEELPAEVAEVVDAANTFAVFVWGPERVKIEYVEHKPTFSLV
jgi:catechol 2,3-dioxygenase-like lactoylglutathione lyase family enzyme